jgi:hypothetical protein
MATVKWGPNLKTTMHLIFPEKMGISFARPDATIFSLTDDSDPYKLFVIGNICINARNIFQLM